MITSHSAREWHQMSHSCCSHDVCSMASCVGI